MFKQDYRFILLLILAMTLTLGLSISLQSILAWTAPVLAPPSCTSGTPGCDAPLNVSSQGQSKDGGLILNHLGAAANGLIVENGVVGLGTIPPDTTYRLQVSGSVKIFNSGNLSVDGNVGIGTTNPQSGLHVFKTEGGVGTKDATITLGGYSTQGATIASYRPEGDSNSRGLMFSTRKTGVGMVDAVTIDQSGNVGIGTSNPGAKLTIGNSLGAGANTNSMSGYNFGLHHGAAQITSAEQAAGDITNTLINLLGSEPGAYGGIKSSIDFSARDRGNNVNTGTMARITGGLKDGAEWNGTTRGWLSFGTAAAGASTPTIRMVIDENGNVGIGVTNPAAKLQLNPPASSEGLRIVSASNWSPFNIRNSGDTADIFRIDQAGVLQAGQAPWARLTNFPAACPANQFVTAVGGTLTCAAPSASGTVGGSGSTNYLPKWTAASTLGDSSIYDSGTQVGINTVPPGGTDKLIVQGASKFNGMVDIVYDGGQLRLSGGAVAAGVWTNSADLLYLADWNTGTKGLTVNLTSGNVGIGTTNPGAKLQLNPPASTEGLRIVSASNWSPLNIRNSGDTADIFRVDQAGVLQVGQAPWARLTNFPAACPANQFVTAVGGTLTCAAPTGTMPAGSIYQTLRHDGTNWVGSNFLYNNDLQVAIGTLPPGGTDKLIVNGSIWSQSGGYKFPDGTMQTTAATGGGGTVIKQGIAFHGDWVTAPTGYNTSQCQISIIPRSHVGWCDSGGGDCPGNRWTYHYINAQNTNSWQIYSYVNGLDSGHKFSYVISCNNTDQWLVYGEHQLSQCTSAGGTVVPDGSNNFCRFNQATCPAGWINYNNWTTATSNTCDGSIPGCTGSPCTAPGHSWADSTAGMTCSYQQWSFDGKACNWGWATCNAVTTQSGCY